jgi:hypothetical protein
MKPAKPKSPRKRCDELWGQVIKARAGHVSELSGKTGVLHAHHIVGKPNHRLRYELDNGICITAGEHLGIHNQGRREEYQERIERYVGAERMERIRMLKWGNVKVDLLLIELYLTQQLREFEKDKP